MILGQQALAFQFFFVPLSAIKHFNPKVQYNQITII